ncbi:MAG: hypothetical protein PSV17_05765 [Methylotenera sp.]|uniref:hypothetical protein n=1 Tax=Methylotenera sp. TaxID=2051956 RepID=UPI0024874FDC|nr:hypothetical protein [Methylotenera sp.]MDI1308924.1 hypothetical protein [Methylotenera sp.]
MKNTYQEKLKRSAKNFHKNSRGEHFSNGLIVRHQYDEENMTKLSWWDDVGFILNSYLVQVYWIHPRTAYRDKAEKETHKKIAHLESGIDDYLNTAEPNYVKVGTSRKKIISHTLNGPLLSSDWTAAFDATYAEIIHDANYQIVPFIKTKWMAHSRFVKLCAPIEVRNEQDLKIVANLVKKLLKRETTLEKEFPGYVYTKDNWISDNP